MHASEQSQTRPSRSSVHRREFLKAGLAGFTGLSLPDLFRLRAEAGASDSLKRTSLIVVWLHGGASHIETYDPKPLAPSEFRGPYQSIATSVPGLEFCELLPRQAAIAHRFTVLRSLVHTGICHDDGPQQIFTGHAIQGRRPQPDNPDLFTITNYLRSDPTRTIPNYVGVNPIPYLGSAYLGPAYESFAVHGDPSDPKFVVPNVGVPDPERASRLSERIGLRKQFDLMRRDLDRSGNMDAMDQFEAQAWSLLSGPDARRAFDLTLEDDATRDRYGRNSWGQQCLMARRLVEAGVELVTVTMNGPLSGRTNSWDDHAVNHNVFEAMKLRAPYFDQAVATLTEEIYERGLDKQVLLIVGGDFGRTPRISYAASTGEGVASAPAGTIQPGRDHWPNAMSFLFSGGGITTGRVIGATDIRGEEVIDRRLGIGDFVATVYRHLGVDAEQITIPDGAGRPIPIFPDGKPIRELMS